MLKKYLTESCIAKKRLPIGATSFLFRNANHDYLLNLHEAHLHVLQVYNSLPVQQVSSYRMPVL